ncbi:hypothetical protein FB550_13313 [Neobacillus bataviensis]|uniref:Uncharacterized protein n=1 Tax=Neobacillus bataviensis TaxID=220685 RepID=A0A561C9L1_9BACI|nr:hypothetical protein FB550_13313 [Neobacillus bataviensis]
MKLKFFGVEIELTGSIIEKMVMSFFVELTGRLVTEAVVVFLHFHRHFHIYTDRIIRNILKVELN